jgi:hypothetical protein
VEHRKSVMASGRLLEALMARSVHTAYRTKRPPKRKQPVALVMPAVVKAENKRPRLQPAPDNSEPAAPPPAPANDDRAPAPPPPPSSPSAGGAGLGRRRI